MVNPYKSLNGCVFSTKHQSKIIQEGMKKSKLCYNRCFWLNPSVLSNEGKKWFLTGTSAIELTYFWYSKMAFLWHIGQRYDLLCKGLRVWTLTEFRECWTTFPLMKHFLSHSLYRSIEYTFHLRRRLKQKKGKPNFHLSYLGTNGCIVFAKGSS